jgi:hypothetical protein
MFLTNRNHHPRQREMLVLRHHQEEMREPHPHHQEEMQVLHPQTQVLHPQEVQKKLLNLLM